MKPKSDAATAGRSIDPTGRDGAIDFAVKAAAAEAPDEGSVRASQFADAMGRAVIDLWSELPRDIQERLFETAVAFGRAAGRDEMMREHLAKFLHDKHERTAR
jgi:hypothetical protein